LLIIYHNLKFEKGLQAGYWPKKVSPTQITN
jgi:hypothetical protein